MTFLFFVCALESSAQAFTRDTSFNVTYNFNTGFSGIIEDVILLPNQMIFFDGKFKNQNNPSDIICRAFLNFEGDFLSYLPDWYWSDGTHITYHQDSIYYHDLFYIYKLSLTGENDTAYFYLQNNENLSLSIVGGFFFVENEKLLVAGSSIGTGIFDPNNNGRTEIVRVNPDFTCDSTWLHDADYIVKRIYRYDDTSFITDGRFQYYYSDSTIAVETNSGIIKFDHNGNVDTNFVSEDLDKWSEIRQLKALKDGRIMVYGRFNFMETSPYYDEDDYYLLRLLPNGQIDTSFSFLKSLVYNPGNCYAYISAIEELDNGSYLIGGLFDSIQGSARGCIAIIDSTGILDLNHFNTAYVDSGCEEWPCVERGVYGITRTEDDKYYVYGQFNRYNGETTAPIIRIFGESYISVPEVPQVQSLIKIYPNPANDHIQLVIQPPIDEGYSIKIVDVNGKIFFERFLQSYESVLNLNCTGYPNGVYFYQLTNKNGNYEGGKFIISH